MDEKQGPLALMETQAKRAGLLSVGELEHVEFYQVDFAVQGENLSKFTLLPQVFRHT